MTRKSKIKSPARVIALDRLVDAGQATAPRRAIATLKPVRPKGGRRLSTVLAEDRDDRV